MNRSFRFVASVGALLVALAGTSGRAQQQPASADSQQTPPSTQAQQPSGQQPSTQPPTFRAGVSFVRVDAIVSDKSGNFVKDLKPEDFEVTEQGKPQKIETFKLVSLDGGLMPSPDGPPREIRTDLDEEREAARDDVRLFAIFLDDYHVRRETSMVARDQIARFVDTQLGPSDMVGLMYPLESLDSLRMTRNHDAITSGLEHFLGRKYEYTPKNEVEERYSDHPTETVEQIRNQVSLTAIRGLITHLGGLKEGRKALILVSEGYSSILPPQMRNQIATMPGSGNAAAGNPNAGLGDMNESRASAMAAFDIEGQLREVYTLANRNNVAIYTVDPRGLAVNEFGMDMPINSQTDHEYLDATMNTLRTLALETDGRAIVNRNDLAAGMKQIVRDTSGYYLLGYTSTFAPTDGKFHEIKVRVKRSGVDVRARKGYWALNRSEVAAASAPPKPSVPTPVENAFTAASAATSTSRARVIRSWIGTERGENGKTKITFVWEPMPKAAGDQVRDSEQPARVALTAAGPDGNPYFRGRVPESLASTPSSPGTGTPAGSAPPAAASRVTFEAPPGKMQLRVSVEGAGSGVLDSEMREIIIPDLTAPQTALATPQFFRARTVREMQQIKADPQAMPVVSRDFSRSDRLLIRVPVYGPGNSAPKVSARLLNRAGQSLADLPVTPAGDASAPPQIEMPLGSVATGDYIIEINATGEGGNAQELYRSV